MRKINLKIGPTLSLIFICLIGIVVYANSLHAAFQFDDLSYIENNPAIYDIKNLKAIIDFHRSRPVGTYTFALNYHFHQLDILGYHLTNLIIHLMTSGFVWWLTRLIFTSPRLVNTYLGNRKDQIALITALLFISHPLQTQAVNYITQRYSSLSAMFYVAALSFYIKARLRSQEGKNSAGYWGGGLLAAFLGVLTKETLITLPLMIILCEYFFLKKEGLVVNRWKQWLFSLGPFLLIVFIIPYLYGFNLFGILSRSFISDSHDGDLITAKSYFLTQPRVILTYLRLLFIPLGQNLDYDFPVSRTLFEWPTLLSFISILLILFLAFRIRQEKPLISFGIFWFFITLSIESSVIPIPHVIFEHRVYLPAVGFCLVLATSLLGLVKNIRIFMILGICVVLIFSYLTIERNKVWKNEVTFWEDVVTKSPRKARPYDNLGAAYLKAGRYEEARVILEKALSINPQAVTTYINLAEVAMKEDELKQAENYLIKALKNNPSSGIALNNLGVIFLKMGDLEQAKGKFLQTLALNKGYIQPRLNLAEVYIREGVFDKAISLYEGIHGDYPHDWQSLFGLLKIYLSHNEKNKAVGIGKNFLKESKDSKSLTETGSLFASQGFTQMALALYSKALEVNPKYIEAYCELGKLYGNLEQFNRAITVWQDGLRVDPAEMRFKELIEKAKELQAVQAGKE